MRRLLLLASVGAALAAAGCGSSSTPDAPKSGDAPAPRGPSSAALRAQLAKATNVTASTFPAAGGRTLRQIADSLDGGGPQLAFATQTLETGRDQRVAFGVVDPKTGFVYAPTALYIGRSESSKAAGPFPAPADLLITDPPYRSQTAAAEGDPFAAIYTASATLGKPGKYFVLAVSEVNGKTIGSTGQITVLAPKDDPIPNVGDMAPKVDTDTLTSAGGDIKKIDTRVPPDDMHADDLKDVLGKKPVALLIATPALCVSRVCGPVVDIAAQLKKTYGSRMVFIHQEVWKDNKINTDLRAPLKAFHLQTEPWLFVMDRTGRITARLEGSFGFRAFENAIKSGLR